MSSVQFFFTFGTLINNLLIIGSSDKLDFLILVLSEVLVLPLDVGTQLVVVQHLTHKTDHNAVESQHNGQLITVVALALATVVKLALAHHGLPHDSGYTCIGTSWFTLSQWLHLHWHIIARSSV